MKLKDIPSIRTYVLRNVLIIFGGFIYAMAINIFVIPHKFLSGGISGIALIITYLTSESNPAIWIVLLNIPIFIFGFKHVDLHFIISSLVGMLSCSFFINLTYPMTVNVNVPDEMLAVVYGGVLTGTGLGIIFRNRGSLGGTDIISSVLKKKFSINMGSSIFIFNIFIVTFSMVFLGLTKGMYTLIYMFICSIVLDKVIGGFQKKKAVMIISENADDIAKSIITNMHRGVTFLNGEGAYKHKSIKVVYCVISFTQLAKLKDIVKSIDKNAFVAVSSTNEIMGNWFQSYPMKHHKRYE